VAKLPQTKTEPKTQLERIASVSPRYASLLTKHAELTARFEEIVEEANGPRGRVDGVVDGKTGAVRYNAVPLAEQARRSQVAWVSQLPKPKPKPIVRHAGAVALLDDLLPEQVPEELSPPPPPASWPGEQRLAELGAEAESITEALKLIAPEITKERKQYSRLVAAQRSAEYQQLVLNIVDIVRELGRAIIQHHKFLDQMRHDGVAYSVFKPINLSAYGNLNEPHTPLLAVLIDAAEKGHISLADLPQFKMPVDISYLQGGE
jgi:hypothetical protein